MRFGLSITLRHFPEWNGSVGAQYRQVLDDVVWAEGLGLESALVTEHHFTTDPWCPVPLTVCAAIAARTERLKVGTAILILPLYNPVRLAEEVAVLDNMFPGRIVLALGMGYRPVEFAGFGVDFADRKTLFEEGLEVLLRAWTQDSVQYTGRHHTLDGISVTPRPVTLPHPEVWIGATAKPGIRRAARYGFPFYLGNGAPLDLLTGRTAYYDQCRAASGLPPVPTRPIMRELYVAPTRAQAMDDAAARIRWMYRQELVDIGYGVPVADASGNTRYVLDRSDPIFEYENLFRDRVVIGSPDDCVAQILRYQAELGTTEILWRIYHPGLDHRLVRRSLELFAKEVMPAVRAG